MRADQNSLHAYQTCEFLISEFSASMISEFSACEIMHAENSEIYKIHMSDMHAENSDLRACS